MLPVAFSFSLLGAQMTRLNPVDVLILLLYFALVIFIGFYVKGSTNTSEEFFLAGREMSAWVAGLSFVSASGIAGANGMGGGRISVRDVGDSLVLDRRNSCDAVPRHRHDAVLLHLEDPSVPGYLHLRFGEGTRAVSAVSFALMTILMSGVNMYAMAVVMQTVLGLSIWFFCGILMLADGLVLFGQGLYEHFGHESATVLANLQPTLWCGVLLTLFGGFYTVRFRPGCARRVEVFLQSATQNTFSLLGDI